uniref:Uncharacterized protein LOC111135482 n=1 Tax=Crassostrea virginica TaxID=6565 RepID=A0A8B8EN67_CRAVI|nr:uncharacterized protein LOC111135482 [Crassostrea virginica]
MQLNICLTIISLLSNRINAGKCYRNGTEVCCSGYIWNQTTGLCDKCPAGYTGQSCFYKCHYPSYGQECDESCDCPTELCDYLFGCPTISTNIPVTIGHSSKNNSDEQHLVKSTETSLVHSKVSPFVPILFYTTVTLISVFVIFALFYALSKWHKFTSSKHEQKTTNQDLHFNEINNSQYECVEFP